MRKDVCGGIVDCCGSGAHFVNEGIYGFGWCIFYELETKCDGLCAFHNDKKQ